MIQNLPHSNRWLPELSNHSGVRVVPFIGASSLPSQLAQVDYSSLDRIAINRLSEDTVEFVNEMPGSKLEAEKGAVFFGYVSGGFVVELGDIVLWSVTDNLNLILTPSDTLADAFFQSPSQWDYFLAEYPGFGRTGTPWDKETFELCERVAEQFAPDKMG